MKLATSIACTLLLFAVANGALLGGNRCTWGPAYWCQHLGTARECNSNSFCAQLWQRTAKTSIDSNPAECSFCKLLIADIEQQLTNNKTEQQIKAAAEKACNLVPGEQMQSLCKTLVDTYLPEVIELVKQELPPAKICAAISLCGSGNRDPALTVKSPVKKSVKSVVGVKKLKIGDSGLCDDCEKVIQTVKEILEKNGTQTEIEQMLKDRVCSKLGPMKAACIIMVDQYVPEILVLLDNDINPKQLCQLLGFCEASKTAKFQSHPVLQLMLLQKSKKKVMNSIECQVCESLINEARELIRQKKTEDEIIEFLKTRVCSLLPAEQDQCKAAVTQYGPIIFQLLVSELDPQTVCQALGACGKSFASIRKVSPAPTVRRLASSASLKPKSGPQCILCEYVLRELDKLIGDNKTVQSVESALESVCSLMPVTVRQDCDAFVKQYTPVVMQLIANDVSPALVCSVVGLCASESVPAVKNYDKSAVKSSVKSSVKSATVCDICQTIVNYAKSLLKENATEQEIAQLIEKACQFLPTAEQAACRAFVDQYAVYVIQLLLQDVEPKKICSALGLCSSFARQLQQQRLMRSQMLMHQRLGQTLRYRSNGLVRMSRTGDD